MAEARNTLNAAAQAWDVSSETLEQINGRIHDGVELRRLKERADGYVADIRNHFPYLKWDFGTALEIGPGVGFIMEAVERAARRPCRITGLDISPSMIAAAQARLAGRDNFSFASYDGVTMPFPDGSFDFVYSVAALQHIPKPHVYNLFFEIERVLRPEGVAVMHFLPFTHLAEQENHLSWRHEIGNQIAAAAGPHWHHFYSEEELRMVLGVGTGFRHVHIAGSIYACVAKAPIAAARRFGLIRRLAGVLRG